VADFGIPRAVIPPLDEFALTPNPEETPQERERRMVREVEKRFGGRAVWKAAWEHKEEREREYLKEANSEREQQWLTELGLHPEWDVYGFRGQVAKLLWERGLKKKAIRFVSCNKCARSGKCRRYPLEHKFFVPHGCEIVFCRECAQQARRALFEAYLAVIFTAIEKCGGIPPGWVLARVNFTLRSDGGEITPDQVKGMNSAVRAVMLKSVGSRRGYGMLFVDEVGSECGKRNYKRHRKAHGLNLHCHGLYFGPRLDWERTRDLWMQETEKRFGLPSRGFYIAKIRVRSGDLPGAVRHALNHMLKYVSKPPAVTPERLASLIAAFNSTKRVHSLGLFYGKKPKRERRDCPCPKCRAMGIVSTVSFEGSEFLSRKADGVFYAGCIPRLLPIRALREQGYEPLSEAGRAMVLSMGAGPP
jgi:hypothetical protein